MATMEMTGEQLIPASQETVWRALNDPAVLKACIPGCESIEKLADDMYRISVLAAVGPIRARFNGKLTLGDLDSPRGYTRGFEVSGGAAGFGKGGAEVALKSAADGRSEEHTSELQSLMRISYAVFCLYNHTTYTTQSSST